MSTEERLYATIFLLGKFHGGLFNILCQDMDSYMKICKIHKLEEEIRQETEKLFYTSPNPDKRK